MTIEKFGFEPDLVLLITGGTNGVLEVCNCMGPMPGGLARRSGVIDTYRKAFDNTLLLDTGDTVYVEPRDVRNSFILKGYRQLGYDIIAMGDQEWAVDSAHLSEWMVPGPTRYLSTNVQEKEGGFTPVKVVSSPDGKPPFAIINFVGQDAFMFHDADRMSQLVIGNRKDLARTVDKLKGENRAVIIVSHGSESDLSMDAEQFDADLFIRGHSNRNKKEMFQISGRAVVQVATAAYVGVVAMKIDPSGTVTHIEYRSELVSDKWPLNRKLLELYQAYAHAAMREALNKDRVKGLDYVPSSTCGVCHTAQYENWKKSKHSHAWKALQKVKRTIDPNCVACHSLGFGTEKGFYTYEKTPELAAVHCQHCHRINIQDHETKGVVKASVDSRTCTSCHTPVTDPKFHDLMDKRMSTIKCPEGKPALGFGNTQDTNE